METTKKWLIPVICLAIVLVACLFWVRSLSERLEWLEQENRELSARAGNLDSKINGLKSEMKEMIREANSLTEELEFTFVGAGTQPNTAAYDVTLTPKEQANSTKVELTVGDTTVAFTRNGDIFMGTVDIPLFEENSGYPILSVTTAGITKKQELEEIGLWYAYLDCLPQLFQSTSGNGSSEDPEKRDAFLAYALRLNETYTDTPVTFEKVTMTKTVNGKEGPCRDVTDQFIDYGDYAEYNLPDITLSKGDRVIVVIRAEDSLGYIHEITSHLEYSADGNVGVEHADFERIYGPDGTVLVDYS